MRWAVCLGIQFSAFALGFTSLVECKKPSTVILKRDVGCYDPSRIFDGQFGGHPLGMKEVGLSLDKNAVGCLSWNSVQCFCAWVYFPSGMQEAFHCHPEERCRLLRPFTDI
ncbi:hypothetical protein CDAR_67921 [Caerostris darwini]|uniref:Secreted protein n=1 Tax=Caerostris darwini TaxID=1538125 RepID=A0AAV4VRQ8_9ARAC|nr:hypothetical protein CDAR_67921 [Caerostris darwini]